MRYQQRDKRREQLRELRRIVCKRAGSTVRADQFGKKKKNTFKASEKLFNSLLPSLEWRMRRGIGVKMGGGRMGDGCGEFSYVPLLLFCHQVKKELASTFVLESRERKGTVGKYPDRNPFLKAVNKTDIMSRVRLLGNSWHKLHEYEDLLP